MKNKVVIKLNYREVTSPENKFKPFTAFSTYVGNKYYNVKFTKECGNPKEAIKGTKVRAIELIDFNFEEETYIDKNKELQVSTVIWVQEFKDGAQSEQARVKKEYDDFIEEKRKQSEAMKEQFLSAFKNEDEILIDDLM